MLKLFRDYLFHCLTEDGRPWMDHAHIVQCLNKLDAGTLEKVCFFEFFIFFFWWLTCGGFLGSVNVT